MTTTTALTPTDLYNLLALARPDMVADYDLDDVVASNLTYRYVYDSLGEVFDWETGADAPVPLVDAVAAIAARFHLDPVQIAAELIENDSTTCEAYGYSNVNLTARVIAWSM